MAPESQKEITNISELAGLVRDVQVSVDKERETILVDLKELKKNGVELHDYIKEVEKHVAKAQTVGSPGMTQMDNVLLSVIPQRHKAALNRLSRTTLKRADAIRICALESWLKNAIWLHNPNVAARGGATLLEEMDKIERGFGFDATQKAALEEGTDAEGGFLVPVPLEAEVLRIAEDEGIMRRLCRVFPMTVKTHNFPDLATNIVVTIIAEEGTITASEPTFGQKALTASKFAVRAIVSMELIQDAAVGILAFLITLMSEKYALKEDQQILEGTGAGGEFTGLVAAANVNEITNGANGDLFTTAKALDQKWAGRLRASRRGSAWVAAPEIVKQIEAFRVDAITAADKAGAFLYIPNDGKGNIAGMGDLPSGVFHGFPMFEHSEINVDRTVGSSDNTSNMYFGPWRSAVVIGDLLGLQFGVSEHTQWATGQLDLRMIKRTAGLVAVPKAMTKQTGLKIA